MVASYDINYNGLKERQTYEEIINYLQTEQEIIRYPERTAKRIRESPYLTQLDGDGLVDMEEQQLKKLKEEEGHANQTDSIINW